MEVMKLTSEVFQRPAVDSSLLLTVAETSRLLRISRNMAYDLIRQNALPHVRLGRRILVPRHGLERWIECQAGLGDSSVG
jgi:excisionase family DNA binding protein